MISPKTSGTRQETKIFEGVMVIVVHRGFLTLGKGIPMQLKKNQTGPIKHVFQRVTDL